MAAQKQWAESLAKSIDFSALNRAVSSSAALNELGKHQHRVQRITPQADRAVRPDR